MHVRTPAALVLALALVRAPVARADDAQSARCAEAYVTGQHLLRERHLLRARDALLVCARDPCPRALRPECVRWLDEATSALPSVVLTAEDADGRSIVDARVTVDGAPLAARLDGLAVSVDPGEHLFVAEGPALPRSEARVVVAEGDKRRPIVFRAPRAAPPAPAPAPSPEALTRAAPLAPAPASPASRAPPAPPASSYAPAVALSGVGLVAAGVFAFFGASGLALRGDLQACRPACPQDRVDAGNRDWVAADVALGVAVVSLAAAAWLWIREQPAPRARAAP